MTLTRRSFGALLLASAQARSLFAKSARIGNIDGLLKASAEANHIPAVVAVATDAHSLIYSGAYGSRDPGANVPIDGDTIFSIASMTKAVATTAAMQLMEQGKVTLDGPVAKFLPELANPQVLEGFTVAGEPVLRPAKRAITLRHLMTHTSGISYPTWHAAMNRYVTKIGGLPPGVVAPVVPLMFEPGTSWQYGYSVDWIGRLVERISGSTLEEYMQDHILQPLEMNDTSYILPAEKLDRMITVQQKLPNGTFEARPRTQPAAPKDYSGGGGLYSTANDYAKFVRMFLNYGMANPRTQILKASSVEAMSTDQIPNLRAGYMKTAQPNVSADVDTNPGNKDGWGLGFLYNRVPHPGGRSAGSLAWAGIYNTFYWIDPKKRIGGVIMMQYLPFVDPAAVAVLDDFERAVYANV